MNKIKISGKEFELYYSTKTMLDVEKRCGDLVNLGEWLRDGTSGEIMKKTSGLVTDLINGAVFKHNADIALGLIEGEKRNFVTDDIIEAALRPADIGVYQEMIFSTMNEGVAFEKPEGIPDADPDLMDVESEKNE